MRTLKRGTRLRFLALVVLVVGVVLTLPGTAAACAAGTLDACWDICFSDTYEACLASDCSGLSGPDYHACRSACWELYRSCIRDCNAFCPW